MSFKAGFDSAQPIAWATAMFTEPRPRPDNAQLRLADVGTEFRGVAEGRSSDDDCGGRSPSVFFRSCLNRAE